MSGKIQEVDGEPTLLQTYFDIHSGLSLDIELDRLCVQLSEAAALCKCVAIPHPPPGSSERNVKYRQSIYSNSFPSYGVWV